MALDRRDQPLSKPSQRVSGITATQGANFRASERTQPPEGSMSPAALRQLSRGPRLLSYATEYERRVSDILGRSSRLSGYWNFEPDESGAYQGTDRVTGRHLVANNGGAGSAVAGLVDGTGNAYATHATLGSTWTMTMLAAFGVGAIVLWFQPTAIGARQVLLDMGSTGGGQVAIEANGAISWATATTQSDVIQAGSTYMLTYNHGFGASVSVNNQNLLNFSAGTVPGPLHGNGIPNAVELGGTISTGADPFIGVYDEMIMSNFLLLESGQVYGAAVSDIGEQVVSYVAVPRELDAPVDGTIAQASGQSIAGTIAVEQDSAVAGLPQKAVLSAAAGVENDAAVAGVANHSIPGTIALENDTAVAGAPRKAVAGTPAIENDAAVAGAARKAVTGTIALENDAAVAGAPTRQVAATIALEQDTAVAGAARKAVAGTVPAEADSAVNGTPRKAVQGTPALENDSAISGTVAGVHFVAGTVAVEQDSAVAGAPVKAVASTPAVEQDAAVAGTVRKMVSGGVAQEQDFAVAGGVQQGVLPVLTRPFSMAIEDTALAADIFDPSWDVAIEPEAGYAADIEDPGGTAAIMDPMSSADIEEGVGFADIEDPGSGAGT